MNELLQKNQFYDWTPNRQIAFDNLKQKFLEEPVVRATVGSEVGDLSEHVGSSEVTLT
jgi:hypothetical protein